MRMNFTSSPFERMMKEVPHPAGTMTTLVRDAVTTRSAKERKNSAGRSSGR